MKFFDRFMKQAAPVQSEAEARKQRSIKILKRQAVPFMEGLPVIESSAEAIIRSTEAIARRVACSLLVIQHACDILNDTEVEESHAYVLEMLRKFGIEDEPTERERLALDGKLERIDLIQVVWQYEADWVLLWALGMVDELNCPQAVCDGLAAIRLVMRHDCMTSFIEAAKPRGAMEILDQADLAFRYDWACVEARIHGQEAPAGLDAGVVVERHKGLNWLIGYGDDWDHLPADT